MPTSTGSIARAPARNSRCEVIMGRVSRWGRSRAWRRVGDLVEIRCARCRSELVEAEVVRELEDVPLPLTVLVIGRRTAGERVVAPVLEPPVPARAGETVV